jgi:hypothetical protein
MFKKTLVALITAAMLPLALSAFEHGAPIFQDSFDTPATFAENWIVKGSAQSTGNANLLRSITRKHEGCLYVVSCNIDENPAGEVTFTLPPEYKYGGSAEVLFENRKVDVKDGKFSDTFPAYSRHVYKVKAGK